MSTKVSPHIRFFFFSQHHFNFLFLQESNEKEHRHIELLEAAGKRLDTSNSEDNITNCMVPSVEAVRIM